MCDNFLDMESRGECIFSIIWKNGALEECRGVETCEQKWYSEKGIRQNNLDYCDKIKDLEKKNLCYLKALYQFAIDQENVSECDKIKNISVLEECYVRAYEGMARKNKNDSICCNLKEEDRHHCFYYAEAPGEVIC